MIRRVAFLAMVGVILLIATPCYAHSLHPVFWGLGPLAPLVTIGSVVGCLPLIAIVAGQALLLHRFIPATYLGSLWRAAVIFALSKVAETLPSFINSDVFFGYVPPAKFTLIVVLMVVAAVAANALLIRLLYWRIRPKMLRVLWLSLALECISCGGLYLTTNALAWLGIIR
jgi:hypothetical protein